MAGKGKHIGFKAAAAKAKAGGAKNPEAAVAATTQKASPAAKKANPRLKKVPSAGSHKSRFGTYI